MKPTENELEIAIVAAERIQESGTDEHHIAKALLYLYQRRLELEKVYEAAEHYLHTGQEEPQRAALVLAIEAIRHAEPRKTGAKEEDPGSE